MKALVARKYGGPDVLGIEEVPEPAVGPGDVLVAVKAASLNPLDFKIREGKLRIVYRVKPPVPLGCDVAGTIAKVGAGVTRFAVGDEVFIRLDKGRIGGLAEFAVAPEAVVAKKPAKLSFAEAASIPLAGLTALQAFRDGGAQAGQRVLILAGAGGVGTLAIQIAKILGLHVTTTTSTKNSEFVRSLGADEVIDYTREQVGDKPREFDLVFDTMGTTELESIGATKPGGVVVGIGGTPDGAFAKRLLPVYARPAIWAMTAKRRRAAANRGVRFVYLFMRPDGAELAELGAWIDAGKLKPIIHQTFPFADSKAAFAELERGRARGKIVVTIP